jgi:hypothetical protein
VRPVVFVDDGGAGREDLEHLQKFEDGVLLVCCVKLSRVREDDFPEGCEEAVLKTRGFVGAAPEAFREEFAISLAEVDGPSAEVQVEWFGVEVFGAGGDVVEFEVGVGGNLGDIGGGRRSLVRSTRRSGVAWRQGRRC